MLTAPNEEPEAAVFAATRHEQAGGDVSLLLAFDPHHRVQRALSEQGLVGREVARAEPRVLLRIEGFVAADDPRAAALTRSGLDSVRVLGSYARI
jgi:cytochrome P450